MSLIISVRFVYNSFSSKRHVRSLEALSETRRPGIPSFELYGIQICVVISKASLRLLQM